MKSFRFDRKANGKLGLEI